MMKLESSDEPPWLMKGSVYQEPLFPPAMLDEFLLQKLEAHRTK